MNKSRILGLIGSGVFALIAIIVVFAIGLKFKESIGTVNWRIHSCIKMRSGDIMNKFKGLYAAGLVFALIGVLFAVLAIFLKDKTGRIMIILELVFIILGMLLIVSGTANFVSDVKSSDEIIRFWCTQTCSTQVF
jgi:hypothetical protein